MYFLLFVLIVCLIGGIIYAAKNPETWYYGLVIASIIPLSLWFVGKGVYAGLIHFVATPPEIVIHRDQSFLTTFGKVLRSEFFADAKSSGKAMRSAAIGTVTGSKSLVTGSKSLAKEAFVKKYTAEEKLAEKLWLEENAAAINAYSKFNLKNVGGGYRRPAAIAAVVHTEFEKFEDVPVHMLHKYPFSKYTSVAPTKGMTTLDPMFIKFDSQKVGLRADTIEARKALREIYNNKLRQAAREERVKVITAQLEEQERRQAEIAQRRSAATLRGRQRVDRKNQKRWDKGRRQGEGYKAGSSSVRRY